MLHVIEERKNVTLRTKILTKFSWFLCLVLGWKTVQIVDFVTCNPFISQWRSNLLAHVNNQTPFCFQNSIFTSLYLQKKKKNFFFFPDKSTKIFEPLILRVLFQNDLKTICSSWTLRNSFILMRNFHDLNFQKFVPDHLLVLREFKDGTKSVLKCCKS